LPTCLPTYPLSYLPTFLPTFLPIYLPTFLPSSLPPFLTSFLAYFLTSFSLIQGTRAPHGPCHSPQHETHSSQVFRSYLPFLVFQ
jgi:hypothetical protein